jgi:hypothetical protein
LLNVEDWAEIRRQHLAEGIPIKEIARRLGLARHAVHDAVRSSTPPRYERRRAGSAVDAVEPDIRCLLTPHPRMPASIIAERIGWTRGMTVSGSGRRAAPGGPAARPGRAHRVPAGRARPVGPVVPAGRRPGRVARPPVLVGVAGYSHWIVARMNPSRQSHDCSSVILACLVDLGRVPRAGVYDN